MKDLELQSPNSINDVYNSFLCSIVRDNDVFCEIIVIIYLLIKQTPHIAYNAINIKQSQPDSKAQY